ncbi:MAG TPA: hypothetical protein VNQ76_09790 [Planctomicrobium sp.]|nr:hypothetical protein [Planctomicrobium sp.]
MFSNRFWVFYRLVKRTSERSKPRWEFPRKRRLGLVDDCEIVELLPQFLDQFVTLLFTPVYTEFVHLGLHGRTPAV